MKPLMFRPWDPAPAGALEGRSPLASPSWPLLAWPLSGFRAGLAGARIRPERGAGGGRHVYIAVMLLEYIEVCLPASGENERTSVPSCIASGSCCRLLLREDSEQPLTEDLLVETQACLEELELETLGVNPLPELREREWDEVFMDLQHRHDTERWSYDTLVRRWLDKQGLPQQHRGTVKIRYARWRKEHRPLDST